VTFPYYYYYHHHLLRRRCRSYYYYYYCYYYYYYYYYIFTDMQTILSPSTKRCWASFDSLPFHSLPLTAYRFHNTRHTQTSACLNLTEFL
jgi:hypothetical protein